MFYLAILLILILGINLLSIDYWSCVSNTIGFKKYASNNKKAK